MVFDMKNDACLVDEVHVLHSLQSAVLSVSEKECLADILL